MDTFQYNRMQIMDFQLYWIGGDKLRFEEMIIRKFYLFSFSLCNKNHPYEKIQITDDLPNSLR